MRQFGMSLNPCDGAYLSQTMLRLLWDAPSSVAHQFVAQFTFQELLAQPVPSQPQLTDVERALLATLPVTDTTLAPSGWAVAALVRVHAEWQCAVSALQTSQTTLAAGAGMGTDAGSDQASTHAMVTDRAESEECASPPKQRANASLPPDTLKTWWQVLWSHWRLYLPTHVVELEAKCAPLAM